MTEDWQPCSLGSLIRIKHGFAYKGKYFVDDPTTERLVTPGNFAIGGGFQEGKPKYYAGPIEEDYVLDAGDLLVTMTDLSKQGDTLGYPAIVPETNGFRYHHNQRIGLVQNLDDNICDPRFLFYRLRGRDYRHHVLATASGSTVRHTSPGRIEQFEIELPPLDEQRAIASVLGSLDDKIELNRRMNRTLEQMAAAIFKAWFVDFDPVRAKASGATTFPGMPQPAFDALPTTFQDSPLGPIPKGWEAGCIGDIATQRRDNVKPAQIDPDTPYIGLEHMPKRSISLDDWETVGKVTSGKSKFDRGEILFGKLRPYFHKVGIAPIDGVCSTDIIVSKPKLSCWYALMLGHLSSLDFVNYTDACSTGTKMPRTNWKDMAKYPIAIPLEEIGTHANDLIEPIAEQILANTHESRTLAEIRDALLPKVLSGEVRVPIGDNFEKASS